MTEPLLEVKKLSKSFGALKATDDVTFQIFPGEIHALIGPNGAGKTTLVNQIAGELKPDSGSICFDNKNVTDSPVHERALAGIARTFQITSVFNNLTVRQNMNLAVQATLGHSFRFWRTAGSRPGLGDAVNRFLSMIGLSHRSAMAADALSHGEKRQLAVAMALAARPKLLLLDEPAAGMGRHESDKIITLLGSIKEDHGILLVEHDMDLVFAVADRISVLVYGKIIATGPPEEIRNNPAVNEAYLGDTHA